MINNRQNGRRRGRGGQRPGNGGSPGRPDNGSRIDNRARGNASQLYEKYKSLAADAQRQGDRVNTEYYLQFADHYFRVLSENRPRFDEQQRARRDEEDEFGADGEDYGQEGEPVRADQYQQERPRYGDRQQQADRPRQEDRPRYEERPRQEDRPRYEERPRQDDRQRQDARPPREDRPRDQQQPREQQPRDQQPREQQPRDDGRDGGRRARNGQANGNHARPEPAPVEVAVLPPDPATEAVSTTRAADMDAEPPRRRGRPRREDAAPAGDEASGFEADRLPPSLSVSASVEPDTGESLATDVEKPRRRRRAAAPVEAPPAS